MVLVNLGTEKAPHVKLFYLSDMQSELLTKGFKPKYKFDVVEYEPKIEEEIDDEVEE